MSAQTAGGGASENFGLLTREQFIQARDEMALNGMLERGNELFHKSEAAWAESRVFKKRMEAASKRDRPLIEADYNAAMARWAAAEADMGAIVNDERYKAWQAKQLAETA